jgi:hypothetical protein
VENSTKAKMIKGNTLLKLTYLSASMQVIEYDNKEKCIKILAVMDVFANPARCTHAVMDLNGKISSVTRQQRENPMKVRDSEAFIICMNVSTNTLDRNSLLIHAT